MSKKDADRLVKDLRHYFAETGKPYVVKLRGSHWHVLTEQGSSLGNFGSTPSDNHFRGNAISQLRSRGVVDRNFR